MSPATLLSCWTAHVFILALFCPESPSVFEDALPSFANVQSPQGVVLSFKFWVQSQAVQLYQHNLQLALEIKFRMQGNWHSVYSDSGGLMPGVPESSFVLPAETHPLCQGATEGKQQNYECVTWGYILWRVGKECESSQWLVYELIWLFCKFIVFCKKNKDDYNWIILCSFKSSKFMYMNIISTG